MPTGVVNHGDQQFKKIRETLYSGIRRHGKSYEVLMKVVS
jgi:hypothetical protein